MLQLWGQVYDLGASEALLGCQGQPLRRGRGLPVDGAELLLAVKEGSGLSGDGRAVTL